MKLLNGRFCLYFNKNVTSSTATTTTCKRQIYSPKYIKCTNTNVQYVSKMKNKFKYTIYNGEKVIQLSKVKIEKETNLSFDLMKSFSSLFLFNQNILQQVK